MNLIEITQFCSAKDTIKKVKRQAKDWGKYLKITHPIKPVCIIHKELSKLNTRKQPYKIGKDFNRYFTREDKQKIGT